MNTRTLLLVGSEFAALIFAGLVGASAGLGQVKTEAPTGVAGDRPVTTDVFEFAVPRWRETWSATR